MNPWAAYWLGCVTPLVVWFVGGRCLVCQRNIWRGFGFQRGEVGDMQLTLGFATFLVTRNPLIDRLWLMLTAYAQMKRKGV